MYLSEFHGFLELFINDRHLLLYRHIQSQAVYNTRLTITSEGDKPDNRYTLNIYPCPSQDESEPLSFLTELKITGTYDVK